MRTAKTLIRLGGCPGWSESSLGAHSVCWFCHVAAHIIMAVIFHVTNPINPGNSRNYDFQWSQPCQKSCTVATIWKSLPRSCTCYRLAPHLSRRTTKSTKWPVRPSKTQISLACARTDQSSLSVWRSYPLSTHRKKTLISLGVRSSESSLGTQVILFVLLCSYSFRFPVIEAGCLHYGKYGLCCHVSYFSRITSALYSGRHYCRYGNEAAHIIA